MTLRQLLMPTVVVAAATLAGAGCHSCSHCTDYSSPVAGCESGTCGIQRAGSSGGGYVVEEPYSAGPTFDEGYVPQ